MSRRKQSWRLREKGISGRERTPADSAGQRDAAGHVPTGTWELAFAVGKKPPLITNAEMGEYLEKGADVEKWLSDLKEFALKECLAGKDVPGWKAVEGRGTRSWTDQDKAFEVVKDAGIDETMLYVKSPLSLAKVEELMGKKAFAASVGDYVIKSPGKPTLVKTSDKREAITNKVTAKEVFKEETNNE